MGSSVLSRVKAVNSCYVLNHACSFPFSSHPKALYNSTRERLHFPLLQPADTVSLGPRHRSLNPLLGIPAVSK